jgi:hypothetical protein
MEQEQMERFDAFNADRDRRNQQQADEMAFAQGNFGGTGHYYKNLALGESVNQRRMQEELQSMGTGMDYRQMLRAESLGFGRGGMDVAGMLRPDVNYGIGAGQGSEVAANMLGMSASGIDLTDTQNAYYSGMLGQGSKYGGGASTYGGSGGTTPQGAAGNTGGGFFSMLSNLGSALFPNN